MLTFEYTFEPTEEEFNLPAKAIDEGNEFGRKLQEIRDDQEGIVSVAGAEGLFTGDSGRTATGEGIEVERIRIRQSLKFRRGARPIYAMPCIKQL